MASLYGVDAARVILTASTSEAYGWLFKVLCDPGDEVLAPTPSYPLFDQLARYEGVELRPCPMTWDGTWSLEGLSAGPRTRAVLLVSPNNPTGSYVSTEDLQAIPELPLIADEVFGAYPIGGLNRQPGSGQAPPSLLHSCVGERGRRVVVLGGLSKYAGLPQMKLGWMVLGGPQDWQAELRRRLELVADTWLSVGTPVQLALPELLECSALTREAIHARVRHNAERLFTGCRDTALTPLPIQGGWYAVLRMPAIASDEEWALRALKQARVLVQPGYFYDFAGPPHLVLSLLTPPRDFERGLARLVDLVAG